MKLRAFIAILFLFSCSLTFGKHKHLTFTNGVKRNFNLNSDVVKTDKNTSWISGETNSITTDEINTVSVSTIRAVKSFVLEVINSETANIKGDFGRLTIKSFGSGMHKSRLNLFAFECNYCHIQADEDIFVLSGHFKKLIFSGSHIKKLIVADAIIDTLDFTDSQVGPEIYLYGAGFRATVPVNFKQRELVGPLYVHLHQYVSGADFIFDPEDTKFFLDSVDYKKKSSLLKSILQRIDKALYPDEYGYYDKQFKEATLLINGHNILNFIDKNWWGYGYDFENILFGSLFAFTFILFLNLFFFQFLREVYAPAPILIYLNQIKHKYSQFTFKDILSYHILRIGLIFLYTAYIWGAVKLDFEKITIKYWPALILLLFEFVLGLICLAYIVNFLLTK